MFRALLAHPQEELHKRHLAYCVRIMAVGCGTFAMPQAPRWVHTCIVTVYHNTVTLEVADTIRSYDLNFHPVPHGVTVPCERYTMRFPVCYGSHSHHKCKEG
jgi:hypothetical protein